jgi:voltage-gated potassium channel
LENSFFPFIVIEKDEASLDHINTTGYNYISGEATEDETLISAGIEQARVLVLVGSSDELERLTLEMS